MKRNTTFRSAALGLWMVLSVVPIWPQATSPTEGPDSVNNWPEAVKERERQREERCITPYADMTGVAYADCYGYGSNPGPNQVIHPRSGEILAPKAPTPGKNSGNVVGTTISPLAPKSAKKAFEKGRAALQKQNWKEARKQYQKAVDLYPQYAAAWSGLGAVLERLNDMAGARNAYTQASTSDPLYVYPWIQLAGRAAKAEDWQELLDTTNQALKLDPVNYPDVYIYNAMARLNLRDFDGAEKSARQGLKVDTQRRFPQINHLLGVIMARRGDLPAAIGYMKSYLRLAPDANDAKIVRKQLAEVEKLAQNRPTVAP
jgi:tetratricopeptide (TPR) repeat protein